MEERCDNGDWENETVYRYSKVANKLMKHNNKMVACHSENLKNKDIIAKYRRQLEELQDIIDIQRSDGNWNYDPYAHGMANGLILALSIVGEDQYPMFLDAPKRWLRDKDKEQEQEQIDKENVVIEFNPNPCCEQMLEEHGDLKFPNTPIYPPQTQSRKLKAGWSFEIVDDLTDIEVDPYDRAMELVK